MLALATEREPSINQKAIMTGCLPKTGQSFRTFPGTDLNVAAR